MESKFPARLYLVEGTDRNFYVFEYFGQLSPEDQINNFLSEPYLVEGEEGGAPKWKVCDYQHNELAKVLFEREIPVLSDKQINSIQIQQEMRRNAELYRSKSALHCKNLKI